MLVLSIVNPIIHMIKIYPIIQVFILRCSLCPISYCITNPTLVFAFKLSWSRDRLSF